VIKLQVKNILYLLLILWLVLAVGRSVFNVARIATEDVAWIGLTTEEKRAKLFGDLHYLLRTIENSTEHDADIIFLSPGGKSYFLARYYLYPRRIAYIQEQKDITKYVNSGMYEYVLQYKTTNTELNEHTSEKWDRLPFTLVREYVSPDGKAFLYKI
jgi:hypothetical protein